MPYKVSQQPGLLIWSGIDGIEQSLIRLRVAEFDADTSSRAAAGNDPIEQFVFPLVADECQQALPILIRNLQR
ncbi:hypothetical protein ASE11_03925 [Hydrogenophaga sp. Root209]|nr:hypothetical protein ASE11_03925 [Hydrogenophaga sp. Root209]